MIERPRPANGRSPTDVPPPVGTTVNTGNAWHTVRSASKRVPRCSERAGRGARPRRDLCSRARARSATELPARARAPAREGCAPPAPGPGMEPRAPISRGANAHDAAREKAVHAAQRNWDGLRGSCRQRRHDPVDRLNFLLENRGDRPPENPVAPRVRCSTHLLHANGPSALLSLRPPGCGGTKGGRPSSSDRLQSPLAGRPARAPTGKRVQLVRGRTGDSLNF